MAIELASVCLVCRPSLNLHTPLPTCHLPTARRRRYDEIDMIRGIVSLKRPPPAPRNGTPSHVYTPRRLRAKRHDPRCAAKHERTPSPPPAARARPPSPSTRLATRAPKDKARGRNQHSDQQGICISYDALPPPPGDIPLTSRHVHLRRQVKSSQDVLLARLGGSAPSHRRLPKQTSK
jgi:hypothetical protein